LCSLKFAINLHMIIEFSNGACDGEPLLYSPPVGGPPGSSPLQVSRKEACAQMLKQVRYLSTSSSEPLITRLTICAMYRCAQNEVDPELCC